jgi:predicted DNA-binding protein with PD1-like motif
MELVSLGGWIATDEQDQLFIHAHFSASTVSDETVVTLGGHLTEGTLAGVFLVVAVAVLEGDNVIARYNEDVRNTDLFFRSGDITLK